MTRDELTRAISNAFDGAYAWAVAGYWNITIETSPTRSLIVSDEWRSKNIQAAGEPPIGMAPADLQRFLENLPDNAWGRDKDQLIYMLR